MTYVTHADLGGRLGLGPVEPEADEPWFHAEWEKRAFALTLAMGAAGAWNLDQSRSAREQLPGYGAMSYYEIWAEAAARLMAEAVVATLARGGPTERAAETPARFAPGDRVRTADVPAPKGHTRLPRYVQGKTGTVTHLHGVHVFPDTHAAGGGEAPEWLYTVRFDAPDLFGPAADPTVSVSVDAWDSYLSPA